MAVSDITPLVHVYKHINQALRVSDLVLLVDKLKTDRQGCL